MAISGFSSESQVLFEMTNDSGFRAESSGWETLANAVGDLVQRILIFLGLSEDPQVAVINRFYDGLHELQQLSLTGQITAVQALLENLPKSAYHHIDIDLERVTQLAQACECKFVSNPEKLTPLFESPPTPETRIKRSQYIKAAQSNLTNRQKSSEVVSEPATTSMGPPKFPWTFDVGTGEIVLVPGFPAAAAKRCPQY